MNAKQQLHQAQLEQWAIRFQEQSNSGLTVKSWCAQNNFSIHTYNYWKHLLKQEYIESVLPDIVPILPVQSHQTSVLSGDSKQLNPNTPFVSHKSRELYNTNSIHISAGNIQIDIGASVSEELLLQILKVVRYA